jgi:bacillithiol synthase
MEIPLIDNFYKNNILKELFEEDSKLKNFHNGLSIDSIGPEFLDERDINETQRKILYNVINEQYLDAGITCPSNLESIKNKGTFTVTTGHQLCVFGGPQYFIHKIISILKLAEQLKDKFQLKNFIPIFWMASEDHDFKEISELHVFNKKLSIDKEDSVEVGKISPEIFKPILNQLKEIFKNDERFKTLDSIFSNALNTKSWSAATRFWLHHIFKNENLIILDADDHRLKNIFAPVIKKEIESQFVYNSVLETNNSLKKHNFIPKINPRELNLFYLNGDLRQRIIFEKDTFTIGDKTFNKDQLIQELGNAPERFSPNVLLRPLYQENILPNLIYVGGPSEISYWAQLKNTFSTVDLNFPVLMLRDHFIWMDEKTIKKWLSFGFSIDDLSKKPELLIKLNLEKNSSENLDFNKENELLNQIQFSLLEKSNAIDVSISQSVEASVKLTKNTFDKLQKKFLQAVKRTQDHKVNQIIKISSLIHENGKLKERSESFIPNYIRHSNDYLKKLKKASNPDVRSLKVVT